MYKLIGIPLIYMIFTGPIASARVLSTYLMKKLILSIAKFSTKDQQQHLGKDEANLITVTFLVDEMGTKYATN